MLKKNLTENFSPISLFGNKYDTGPGSGPMYVYVSDR